MSSNTEQKNNGKKLTGVVVSTKMKDTAVVEVVNYSKHQRYHKFIKTNKKYHTHDLGNTKQEGDKVTIVECAQISKKKHFRIVAE